MAQGDRIVLAHPIMTLSEDKVVGMGVAAEKIVQDVLYKLAQETRDMARRLAPSKTGALRASIYVAKLTAQAGVPGSPYTKGSVTGYWRALNAAKKRNNGLELLHGAGLEGLNFNVHHQTNRPLKGADNFNINMSEPLGGHKYRAYSAFGTAEEGEGTGIQMDLPSLMELGQAGRGSFFVTIGVGAYYGGYVEFGHVMPDGKHVAPKPFFTPALKWAQEQAPIRIKVAFEQLKVSAAKKG